VIRGDDVNTPSTLRRVAKPPMVMRSIRVPEKLWNAARALCDEREENISDVVREALERYVAGEEEAS
jgi:Arc/MetJ-type ribon-helix-helix transcriptional regulator